MHKRVRLYRGQRSQQGGSKPDIKIDCDMEDLPKVNPDYRRDPKAKHDPPNQKEFSVVLPLEDWCWHCRTLAGILGCWVRPSNGAGRRLTACCECATRRQSCSLLEDDKKVNKKPKSPVTQEEVEAIVSAAIGSVVSDVVELVGSLLQDRESAPPTASKAGKGQ